MTDQEWLEEFDKLINEINKLLSYAFEHKIQVELDTFDNRIYIPTHIVEKVLMYKVSKILTLPKEKISV